MGADFLTRTYKETNKNKVKQLVQADQDQDGYEDGHSYSGSWSVKDGINFINRTFTSADEAEEYIADNNDKWGAIDCCYFEQKLGTDAQNARIKTQREKVTVAEQTLRKFYADTLAKIKGVKAKTKKCKSCGAVHQVEHIRMINCSNCNHPMLTDTELKKETRLKDKVQTEKDKVQTLISKRGGKTSKGFVCGGWCSS